MLASSFPHLYAMGQPRVISRLFGSTSQAAFGRLAVTGLRLLRNANCCPIVVPGLRAPRCVLSRGARLPCSVRNLPLVANFAPFGAKPPRRHVMCTMITGGNSGAQRAVRRTRWDLRLPAGTCAGNSRDIDVVTRSNHELPGPRTNHCPARVQPLARAAGGARGPPLHRLGLRDQRLHDGPGQAFRCQPDRNRRDLLHRHRDVGPLGRGHGHVGGQERPAEGDVYLGRVLVRMLSFAGCNPAARAGALTP
ncbi:hypothetical protein QFZ33_001354 [Arthrobacter globiformis]|nr:hypothetical protein [Arthrobacter globiformis]